MPAYVRCCLIIAVAGTAFSDEPKSGLETALKDRHGDPLPPGATARLGAIRLRATADGLRVGSDGKTVQTVSGGRMVATWNAATGALLGERRLPGLRADDGQLSPDTTLLALHEFEKEGDAGVGVWSLATGKRLFYFPRHWGPFAFAPDGKTLATSSYQSGKDGAAGRGAIHLCDLATGKERVLATLPSYAHCLAFAPDGDRLYGVIDSHSVRCWDLKTGKQLWQDDHAANKVVVAADGKTIVTDTYLGGPLLLWDAATGKTLAKLGAGDRTETANIALSADGKYLAQATWTDTLLWNVAERKVECRFAGAGPLVAFAPDSKSVYTGGALLLRWDVATGKLLYADARPDAHVGPVSSLAFAPDGRSLATSGADGTVRVWKRADGSHRILRADAAVGGARVLGGARWGVPLVPLSFTPDGRLLLTDIDHDKLALTDVATGKEVRRFQAPADDEDYYFVLATAEVTSDGRKVLVLGRGYERRAHGDLRSPPQFLRAWDVATGEMTLNRRTPGFFPSGVLSPDGRLRLAPHGKLFVVHTGVERRLVDAPIDVGPPLAFASDGRLLAIAEPHVIAGPGTALRIYETITRRLITRFEAPLGYCRALGFSPDGRLLAAAGRDALHVWESATGKRLLHLPVEGRLTQWDGNCFARCLAFAPDGKALATGHADGTVLLWDLTPALANLETPAGPVDSAACWADLADADAAKAQAAIERLASAPEQAMPLLKKNMTPMIVDAKWLAARLEDLGSEKFTVRAAATRDLEKVAAVVESDLRRALEKASSLEARCRLTDLLKVAEADHDGTPPLSEVRKLRAVVVLERIRSAPARALLRGLAAGAPDAPLTRAAREALERLRRAGE